MTSADPPAAEALPPRLTRGARQSLAQQLADRYASRIRDRLLAPGARLPSVRQCATQNGVNPSTVVAAYDLLLAHGLVDAKRNRGFFVRERHAVDDIGHAASPGGRARVAARIDASTLIRAMFHGEDDRPQPGMGVFPPDWLDTPFLATALRKVSGPKALADSALRYGDPRGDPGLRRALSDRLRRLGLPVVPDSLVTTVGATHALDIVSRTLLRPGDSVLVEEPGWTVEFARLQSLGMRVLPVPRGPEGPDLGVMERLAQAHAPRLFVGVSVLHNPTGCGLSPACAHRVLQLAQRHDFHIVEDDTYGPLAPEHATRMSVLDGLQRTLYVGGFAKVLAPNWRVGFVAAPQALVERLVDTKLLSTLTTPSLFERALALCIEQGLLRRHVERLRARLDAARGRSVRLAVGAGCRFVTEPAGLFGWVDAGCDTEELAQRLLDDGYLIAPGALFHAARAPGTLMRINFANSQDARFWRVFKRAVGGAG